MQFCPRVLQGPGRMGIELKMNNIVVNYDKSYMKISINDIRKLPLLRKC